MKFLLVCAAATAGWAAAEGKDTLASAGRSTDALLSVLDDWNLRAAFEPCFTDLQLDGDALLHSSHKLVQAACPNVPMLQWDRLWRRVAEDQGEAASNDDAKAAPVDRRRLGLDDATQTGIHLNSNSSRIVFGDGGYFTLGRDMYGLSVDAPVLNVAGDVQWAGASPLDANISALVERINDLEAALQDTTEIAQECSLQFQARACMSSTSQLHDQSHFFSSYSGTIHGCMLVYHSGYVDCSTGSGNSNWGCHDDSTSIGTFILDADDESVIFPSDGTFSWSGSSGAWYAVDDDLGWWPSAAYLYFPGEMEVAAGDTFHLQYGEAWQQYTTSDNSGTTCADIYWKVGDCDIQAYGRQ